MDASVSFHGKTLTREVKKNRIFLNYPILSFSSTCHMWISGSSNLPLKLLNASFQRSSAFMLHLQICTFIYEYTIIFPSRIQSWLSKDQMNSTSKRERPDGPQWSASLQTSWALEDLQWDRCKLQTAEPKSVAASPGLYPSQTPERAEWSHRGLTRGRNWNQQRDF